MFCSSLQPRRCGRIGAGRIEIVMAVGMEYAWKEYAWKDARAFGNRAAQTRTVMTHERFRKFNTRDTYPDQKLDNDLCQVVKAGNILFLRGQVGTDFDGNLVGGHDAGLQTEQAMKNVKTLLEEAGSELGHVCKITIYLTNPSHREAVYRVVGKWLKGVFPVSTGVVVAALAKPDWLMEIDVIAVLPDKNA